MRILNIKSQDKKTYFKSSKKNSSKTNNTKKGNIFDEYAPKKLPSNKAVQIVRRPGLINLLNIITIPFGIAGISTEESYKLVDIDLNNLTPKQEKLIRKGKLINFVPRGYHVENNKIAKNK